MLRSFVIHSEENVVVYFSVTSDGTTGEEWIARLEKKGFRLSKWAKDVLLSPDFKPTNGVVTDVAVLKAMLWNDDARITSTIRTDAYAGTFMQGRKLSDPNAEVSCLIREKFTDAEIEAMGLVRIVVMHQPINDSDGDPVLLAADRGGDGQWLGACDGRPDGRWGRGRGFAFAVAQVSTVGSAS